MEYMLSVGIDIGTSTSQVIFSQLAVENTAGYFSIPSVAITDKKVIYKSAVYRTPFTDEVNIDGEALRELIAKEYRAAKIPPENVQTGAVIITGEAARKENAQMVLEQLSSFAGDFVVSTAGPDLESVIAGQGSGAQQFSEKNGTAVVNLDIGGGTANAVLFLGGEVLAKGCVDIGGRQVTLDEYGRISYISPSAAKIAEQEGISLRVGEAACGEKLEILCNRMNNLLEQMLGVGAKTDLLDQVETRGAAHFSVPEGCCIQDICFSGGVAECIYHLGKERFAYGDIGVLLGEQIRRGRLFRDFRVLDPQQTISATVIGAGSYTTSVSGSTIAYTQGLFPRKNIPVLKLDGQEEQACWDGRAEILKEKIRWFLEQSDEQQMVLAMEGRKNPDYEELKILAGTILLAMDPALPPGEPIIVILHMDTAKALGQLLRQKLTGRRPVIVIDEIRAENHNFIDLGCPVMDGLVIPVVVKTLIFG